MIDQRKRSAGDYRRARLRRAGPGLLTGMQRTTIVAVAMVLATAPAFGQGSGIAGSGTVPLPAKPATAAPARGENPAQAAPAKPAIASTPESRSAAALGLSHETTYDAGTAQRIREAALRYSA